MSGNPERLAELLKLIDNGTISGKIAKTVFDEMWKSGKAPQAIVEEQGLVQVSDTGDRRASCRERVYVLV